MTLTDTDYKDPGLRELVQQLLTDNSLCTEGAQIAEIALAQGLTKLDAEARGLLEKLVIGPYVSRCEACDAIPGWNDMLHVYDTGVCQKCFEQLAGADDLGVRPDWMPLVIVPDEDELAIQPEDEVASG